MEGGENNVTFDRMLYAGADQVSVGGGENFELG